MKQKLKEKYLSLFPKRQMMDNWLNLKQLKLTCQLSNCYAQLEEMKFRRVVREEQLETVTRFINELTDDLRKKGACTILSL